MLSQIQNSTTLKVSLFYKISKSVISNHFLRNSDEFIENIHYFYTYEQTKGAGSKELSNGL